MATKNYTMMTGRELAETLKVSRAIVSKWTKEGLPCSYIGKVREASRGSRPRYDMDEVKAWLRSRSTCSGCVSVEVAAPAVSRGLSFNQAVKEVLA